MRFAIPQLRAVHAATLAWILGFVAYTATVGLPTKRSNVLVWVVLAILAIGARSPRRTLRALLLDWSPILVALVAYDLLRGMSDGSAATAHVAPHLTIDEWLGAGQSLSVRLQDALHGAGEVRWYDYPVWAVYTSHFLVPLGLAVILWAVGSSRFRPYLSGLALLSWLALLTYWLYPAQPPWMTGKLPGNEPVVRIVHGMWKEVGIERAARVWAPGANSTPGVGGGGNGSRYSNPVAALPSLHAAFPMFILLVMRGVRRWLTAVLAVYTVAMGFVLVYAGEHFVFDVVLGWAYAALAAGAMAIAFRRYGGAPVEPPGLDIEPEPLPVGAGVGGARVPAPGYSVPNTD